MFARLLIVLFFPSNRKLFFAVWPDQDLGPAEPDFKPGRMLGKTQKVHYSVYVTN